MAGRIRARPMLRLLAAGTSRNAMARSLGVPEHSIQAAVFDSVVFAGWDCGGNLGPKPSYAARPRSLRCCMGLL